MKHYILANPFSGKKKGLKLAIATKKLLNKNNITADIIVSKYPKYFTKTVKKLSNEHKCRFYVLGGDGTLNEAISGIIGSDSEIVVIPCGTGNDFIKSVSSYLSMRKIIKKSINTPSTKTDVIKVNNDMYCVNILNCGFDALVAKNVDIFRNFPLITGKMKYNLAILYTLLKNKNYKFKIKFDNDNSRVLKGHFTLVAVANGKFYGGGISPCPEAFVTDGILDTCVIDSTTILKKVRFFPKYNKSKHTTLKECHMQNSKEVTIVSTKDFPVSIDGEVIYKKKLHLKVLPSAVNIVHIQK